VDGRFGVNQNGLASLTVDSMTLHLALDTIAAEILFIGQHGAEKAKFSDQSEARYTLSPEDTYIRTEIKMDKSKIFLNPVFKYDDSPKTAEKATVNWPLTWLYRFALVLIYGIVIYLVIKRKKVMDWVRVRVSG